MIAEDVESGQTSSANVTIRLTDINDHPPVFVSPVFSANVLETAPRNTEVLTVKVFFFFLLPSLQGRQQKLPSAEAFK